VHQHHRESADTALSDLIEVRARRDLFAAAPADFGCTVMEVPGTGATLMRVPAMPTPAMNRVVGLPGGQALTEQTLAWMKEAYAEGGVDEFWLHAWALPVDAALQASYTARGWQPDTQQAWIKFLFDLDGPLPTLAPHPVLRVRQAGAGEAAVSGAIVCRSFGMAPAMVPWMGAVAGRPGWQVYFACNSNGVPVATAALFIDGLRAWLGMGATLPEARRMGAQQMLLAARMAAAKAAGCLVAGIETEAPAAGGMQHSVNNVRRAGFREIGRRFNYRCGTT
jgi:ribosomal protein S18 acetylase RimI-like enzyme